MVPLKLLATFPRSPSAELTVEMETKVRLGEMDSSASDALIDELRDLRIDAIFSANTSADKSTS